METDEEFEAKKSFPTTLTWFWFLPSVKQLFGGALGDSV